MNRSPDDAVDLYARRVHADALDALSPRVQAQLAQRRRAALAGAPTVRPPRAPWGWLSAGATACVLVIALQLRPPADPADAPPRAVTAVQEAPADPGAVLAEDPDFYLWLASGESQAYAVE